MGPAPWRSGRCVSSKAAASLPRTRTSSATTTCRPRLAVPPTRNPQHEKRAGPERPALSVSAASQRSAVSERALELDELELELEPPPPFPPPPFPPPPDDELELLDELLDDELPDDDPLDEELDDDPDDDPDEELLDDEVLELVLVVDELVLVVDEACCDELLLAAAWLELDETIGSDTLVGSVMPTQAVASAAGALTSSSRKLRRAVSSG